MRNTIKLLCCAILLAGCASQKTTTAKPDPQNPASVKPVVTFDSRPIGKVARVNAEGRFIILSYSPGELPKPDARLNIYRNGLKVAEVQVDANQPPMGNNTVANIITGDVQPGDEARQD
jgi:hypothetical protein